MLTVKGKMRVCFVFFFGFLTSSSTTRLYCGRAPRLTYDNYKCCHTQDRVGRPWLLSQLVKLYWHRPNQYKSKEMLTFRHGDLSQCTTLSRSSTMSATLWSVAMWALSHGTVLSSKELMAHWSSSRQQMSLHQLDTTWTVGKIWKVKDQGQAAGKPFLKCNLWQFPPHRLNSFPHFSPLWMITPFWLFRMCLHHEQYVAPSA